MGQNQETYRDLRPAFLYDTAAIETWLEDWSGKGYRLVDFRGMRGIFVQAEPESCRWRLTPLLKKERKPDPAQLELYGELGWTYAATMAGTFHLWRCEDPAAPEPDTDPVVQAEGYRYLKRQMVWELLGYLMVWAVLICLEVWSYRQMRFPMLELVRRSAPGTLTFRLLFIPIGLAFCGLDAWVMRRMLRRLRAGIPVERPKPYRHQKWVNTAVTVLCAAILFTGTVDDLFGDTWALREMGRGEVYVDLVELGGVPSATLQNAGWKTCELAPRQYAIRQAAQLPGGGRTQAETEYYHMLSPRLVPAMERDLLAWNEIFNSGPMTRVEDAGLDVFWWSEADVENVWWKEDEDGEHGRTQFVIAARGGNILNLRYEGPVDLRTRGAYFAGMLAK